MTALAARTLAGIVEEANRRHAEIESATMGTTRSMLTAELARFYAEHGPLLLAVAEAAERFRVSGERWLEMPEGEPETEKEWEVMNDAREELFALLTGTDVRGEEKTS